MITSHESKTLAGFSVDYILFVTMNIHATAVAVSALKNGSYLKITRFSSLHTSILTRSLTSFEEIQLPVPWGHVSGKWWGRKDVTPVLGLHGFEDNSGTFDRLAPMLKLPAFLALDAPGHGRSSHIPNGMTYNFIDFVINFRRVVKHYGWEKFSIIGHSFGSCMGHIYASLYPSEVDKLASLDCTRGYMAYGGLSGVTGLPLLRSITDKTLKSDRDFSTDPPAYTFDDAVSMYCRASAYSIAEEHASPLISRGLTTHPNRRNLFYFSRDQKLRGSDFNRPHNEQLQKSAQSIKCHVLTILGSKGFVNVAPDTEGSKVFHQFEEAVKKSAASYNKVIVPGTHHVHLNNPERVAPLINKFFGY